MFGKFRTSSKSCIALLALTQLLLPCAAFADEDGGKQPLKGGVDETDIVPTKQGVLKPEEAMPAPVLPKKLEGNVESNDGKKLQGTAQDDGDVELKPMPPKTDQSKKLLQGAANMENSNLGAEDPDEGDKELAVQWDKWRNRFLWAIQSGVQEILNNSQDGNLRWDPRTQTVVRQFPLGTSAWFYCQVTSDRRIVNFKFLHGSGFPNYDQAVQESIAALAGSSILKFPANSRRLKVEQAAGIKTAESAQNEFFHFGDTEKYRVPTN